MDKLRFHNNRNIISAKVKEARKRLELHQEHVAAKMQVLGVNILQRGISEIENNKRLVTDYELYCLSKVLKVNIEWFFSDFSLDDIQNTE